MKSYILFFFLLFVHTICISQIFEANALIKTYDHETIALEDINNDGLLDIVSSSMLWYENMGDAIYDEAKEIVTIDEYTIFKLAFDDMDGDGDRDMVFGTLDGYVIWSEKLGPGVFGEMDTLAVTGLGSKIKNIHLVDLDADGNIDILSAAYASGGDAFWIKNNGGGTFSPSAILLNESYFGKDVFPADLDNDGDLDVAVICGGSTLFWVENTGLGTFAEGVLIDNTISQGLSLACDDYDGDGDQDIIIGFLWAQRIGVYKNFGDGTFDDMEMIYENVDDPSFQAPHTILVADVNADGLKDIISGPCYGKILWLESLGGGTYASPVVVKSDNSEDGSDNDFPIVIGDMDNDSDMDIASSSRYIDRIFWCENIGESEFAPDTMSIPWMWMTSVEMGDLDADGDQDVLVGSGFSAFNDGLRWFENEGEGEFSRLKQFANLPENLDYFNVVDFKMIDLNDDDQVDILIQSGDYFGWMENIDGVTYASFDTLSAEGGFNSFDAADIDGDGDIDFMRTKSDGTIQWYETFSLEGGSYDIHDLGGWWFIGANQVNLSDLDNDGDYDLLLVTETYTEVVQLHCYENTGGGEFSSAGPISADITGHYTLGDLDGDGDLDIGFRSSQADYFGWCENLGELSFSDEIVLLAGANVYTLDEHNSETIITDLDNDGDNDFIATIDDIEDKILWLENLGGAYFSAPDTIETYIEYGGLSQIMIGDVDLDGNSDLLSFISINTTAALYFEGNISAKNNRVSGYTFADLNLNGVYDSTDVPLEGVSILVDPGDEMGYSNTAGLYQVTFDEVEAEYTIYPDDDVYEYWTLVTDSASYNIQIDSTSFITIDSLNFGFAPDTSISIIEVTLTSAYTSCDDSICYWIDIKNSGITIPSGIVHLVLDDSLDFISAEILPDSIVGQNVYWHYDSLAYFDSKQFKLTAAMPGSINEGLIMTSYANGTIEELDTTLIFYDTLSQVLSCEHLANHKKVSPSGIDSLGYVPITTEELEFTIYFENTTSDTIYDLKIIDELDDALNWDSFELISSSHATDVVLTGEGVLEFEMDNILLPDSITNPSEYQGFLKYRLNLLEGLPAGTVIKNKASILFDEADAIETNITHNTLYDCDYLIDSIDIQVEACQYDTLVGQHLFEPDFLLSSWEILGEEYSTFELNWPADSAGTFELTYHLDLGFCTADTALLVDVLESHRTVVDTHTICLTDSLFLRGAYRSEPGVYYDSLIQVNGCDSLIGSLLIVNPLPEVNFSELEDETLCLGAGSVALIAAPPGGDFSGAGVVESNFNPTSAGEGTHTLYYTYEDENSCTAVDSLQVTVVDCLGLSEQNGNKIAVYPNPFDDFTTVNFGKELTENHTLVVYDILGQEVYRNENVVGQNLEIKKEQLGVGIYVLSLFNTDMEVLFSTKLIIE